MKKIQHILLLLPITMGLLFISTVSRAVDKVMLTDGTVLPITRFTFDGKHYQVETTRLGSQRYEASEVTCIGSACGSKTIAPPPIFSAPPAKARTKATTLSINGSDTIGAELMPALLRHHATQQQLTIEHVTGQSVEKSLFVLRDNSKKKRFSVHLNAYGSATAFQDLQTEKASIGMSSRRIKQAERSRLKANGLGDLQAYGSEHVLGLDGLAIIVHRRNSLEALSLSDLAKIFSGQITNWQQLGGQAGKIKLYSRDDQSGTYDTFNTLVLKPERATLTATAKRFKSTRALSKAVANDRYGIGFTGFGYIGNNKTLALQGACGIRSMPSRFSVKTEEYPLARRLFLYTAGKLMDLNAELFLKTALSDSAQAVISDHGFINQQVILSSTNQEDLRLAAALKMASNAEVPLLRRLSNQVAGAKRTSINFRFRTGSQTLDNKAKEDIGRLVRFLQLPHNRSKKVMLLGFSDSKGSFTTNQQLSKKRAKVVATVLRKEGIYTDKVLGYGELAPVACNKGQGLKKNRRVEVWLK